MGIFDDIGGHFDTFFNRTLPSVGRDITSGISHIWNDNVSIVKDVIHVPSDVVKSIAPIANNTLSTVQNVSTSAIQNITGAVQQTVTQSVKSVFESPMVIIAGIGALLFLTKGGGSGKLGF